MTEGRNYRNNNYLCQQRDANTLTLILTYIKLTRKLKFSTPELLYSKPTFTWVPLIQI